MKTTILYLVISLLIVTGITLILFGISTGAILLSIGIYLTLIVPKEKAC